MSTHLCPFSKVNSTYIKHKVCVNLVAQASPAIELGTVQTGTGMVEPARKLKCTMASLLYGFVDITLQLNFICINYTYNYNEYNSYEKYILFDRKSPNLCFQTTKYKFKNIWVCRSVPKYLTTYLSPLIKT